MVTLKKKMNALDMYLRTHGIKQIDFCKKVGMTNSNLSLIIRGKQTPSLATAYAIEKATNGEVTMYEWIEDEIEEVLEEVSTLKHTWTINKV